MFGGRAVEGLHLSGKPLALRHFVGRSYRQHNGLGDLSPRFSLPSPSMPLSYCSSALYLFPTLAFRQGYDFSFIPTQHLRWVAVAISAVSAAICEETGFRGYMQQPIELSYGAPAAIAISSFLFMAVHLTKSWALVGMIPIVFGAGLLLGLLAWSSESLIPGMIGHTVMDVGLFAYWWTGIAGTFTARPISESGVDRLFVIACGAFTISLSIVLLAITKLRRKTGSDAKDR